MSNLPLCTHRYFMMVSYVGTKYNGSQRQVDRNKTGVQDTVQEALEVALEAAFFKTRCRLTAGSRTDKGVHALMNCFTLPLMDFTLPTTKFKRLVNERLIQGRHEIAVNEVLLVPADFHPQKAAISREYIYRIGVPRVGLGSHSWRSKELSHVFPATELYRILPIPHLDLAKLEAAANLFRGTHDFRSFSYRPRETENTVRSLEIDITPAGGDMSFGQEQSYPYDIYNVHFKSRAFLYNQIRRMVGSMLSYATFGTVGLDDIQRLLDKTDSTAWEPRFVIAEPWGLYLSRLNYDKSSFSGSIRTHEDVEDQESVDLDELPVEKDTLEESQASNKKLDQLGDCNRTEAKEV